MKKIIMSKHSSAFGIVQEVERYLLNAEEQVVKGVDNIFTRQALRYLVGNMGDIWSKTYPTAEEACKKVLEHTGITIELT